MTDPVRKAEVQALGQGRQLPVRIVNADEFVPKFATTFSISPIDTEEWVLTIATLAPPAVVSEEQLSEAAFAPAFTGGRFILTRRRAAQLMDLLARVYNEQTGQEIYRRVETE